MRFSYLIILGIIVAVLIQVDYAFAQTESTEPVITVTMKEPSTFYLDESNQIIRASVDIENYTPSDGIYFMKVTHLPTQKVMKDFEIYPKSIGNDLWRTQIAYPFLESDIKVGNQTLFGEFEINIRTEYGSQTASTQFLILETFVEPEPIPEPVVEELPEPIVEELPEPIVEELPEPVVEELPEPVVEELPEIIQENEKNNSTDDPITFQVNEGLIEDLIPILPYLGIVIAGIIVGIIVIIKKSNSDDDEFSDDEFEDDSIIETSTLTPKFQDLQTGSQSDSSNGLEPHHIIEDKIQRILKLQENKIGDYNKLEAIKKSLIDDGAFTKEDNDYLEEKFKEYKKNTDNDSKTDES